MMAALLNTQSNAKRSMELLQNLPLHQHTKENIRKLREMFADDQTGRMRAKHEGKSNNNKEASLAKDKMRDEKGKGKNVCFGDVDNCLQDKEGPEMKISEEKQVFLVKIIEEIEILLQMKEGGLVDEIEACRRNQNEVSNALLESQLFTEICALLLKIGEELKEQMRNPNGSSPNQQNTSDFSYNTHPNSKNSNSGSVRSLLTEKLRQFASQDFDDPERNNERVVIQGNLMRQLSKYSSGSKPMIVSRRFQDLSQPFSMQNKIVNKRELQKWAKEGGRKDMKGRVHSQRTILGEINLSESHLQEKRAQKGESGCSRCEIY